MYCFGNIQGSCTKQTRLVSLPWQDECHQFSSFSPIQNQQFLPPGWNLVCHINVRILYKICFVCGQINATVNTSKRYLQFLAANSKCTKLPSAKYIMPLAISVANFNKVNGEISCKRENIILGRMSFGWIVSFFHCTLLRECDPNAYCFVHPQIF